MTNSIEENISKLTTLPRSNVKDLITLTNEVICDEVINGIMDGDDVFVIDIGIGTLSVYKSEDSLEYKFIPSSELEGMLIDTINNNRNPLIERMNKMITKRVITKYKNLM